MKRYRVQTEWSGYSRGLATFEVEAECESDAGIDFHYGIISQDTIRDDTEHEVVSVTEITDEAK